MIALKDQTPCVGWQSNETMIEKLTAKGSISLSLTMLCEGASKCSKCFRKKRENEESKATYIPTMHKYDFS